ncbi:glycoside hydrolase family 5 protein [Jatrophihabitans sp. YIM 134969]
MGQIRTRHGRRRAVLVAVTLAAGAVVGTTPDTATAAVPLSITVVGNHFVNGAGKTVRLLGVNHPSTEYACVDGYGYDDGHFDGADAKAVASWGANAVRVPMNEDCWLGINGQPNSNEGADPALTQAGYQQEIVDYVAALHRHGLYAILDLHWSAPGSQVALEQQPMPDLDHAPAFWTSVATRFRSDHAVVFDLFNEPYDPTDPRSGDDQDSADTVTWNCWQTGTTAGTAGGGPCSTTSYDENDNPAGRYTVAGLQTLVDAVRATGAHQPVLAGGLDHANDLGDTDHGGDWLNHGLQDPRHAVAASFHNYMGKACDHLGCWQSAVAGVAAKVPVVTGEFAEDNYLVSTCSVHTANTFDATYMKWADSAGVSYLAWGWVVESPAEIAADGCSAYTLIKNYTTHTPAKPHGVAVRNHLQALASG